MMSADREPSPRAADRRALQGAESLVVRPAAARKSSTRRLKASVFSIWTPFGGVGGSGGGQEGGDCSREFFTEPMAIVIQIQR